MSLIVLEGVDGAGTSTQTGELARHLAAKGRTALVTREPSDRRVGRLIRDLLGKDREPMDRRALALLFAADRLDHVAGEIAPAVAGGAIVISDRYLWSSLVYQSLALPRDEVAALNRHAPPADLTLLLEISVEAAAARRAQRGGPEEIFDDLATQRELSAGYERELALALARGERAVRIDASRSIPEVAAAIAAAVDSFLEA